VVTADRSEFESCRRALEAALRDRVPNAVLRDFGGDTRNPGVKVDVSTEKGMANISLWQNLSFDVEAVENNSGRLLLHKSTEDVTPSDVTSTIMDLVASLR
jgi:hypothetical protein